MRISTKLGLTGLMAAMLLASALSTASARNLEISSQGFLVSWSRLEFQSSVATVRCQVTLDGSYHSRTIAKTVNLLIGAITEVRIKEESCTNGSASINRATLPWHVLYRGFTGTLPRITGVRIAMGRYRFTVTVLGVPCTYGISSDTTTGSANLGASGEVTELTPVAGSNTSNLFEGRQEFFFSCPLAGNLVSGAGDGRVSVLNAWTTRVTVRLI